LIPIIGNTERIKQQKIINSFFNILKLNYKYLIIFKFKIYYKTDFNKLYIKINKIINWYKPEIIIQLGYKIIRQDLSNSTIINIHHPEYFIQNKKYRVMIFKFLLMIKNIHHIIIY